MSEKMLVKKLFYREIIKGVLLCVFIVKNVGFVSEC